MAPAFPNMANTTDKVSGTGAIKIEGIEAENDVYIIFKNQHFTPV